MEGISVGSIGKGIIRNLFWDVDDTLLDFKKSERYALEKALNEQGINCDEKMALRYSKINEMFWKRMERGEITREEVLVGRFEMFFAEQKISLVDMERILLTYPKALGEVYFYKDDSFRLLTLLRKKGYKNYLLTNGAKAVQIEKLKRASFLNLVDGLFISEEIGFHKPQKEFFEYCLENIGPFDKSECLMIGDSLSSDMLGAANIGIPSCWYRQEMPGRGSICVQKEEMLIGEKLISIDYQISNLWQIRDILSLPAKE